MLRTHTPVAGSSSAAALAEESSTTSTQRAPQQPANGGSRRGSRSDDLLRPRADNGSQLRSPSPAATTRREPKQGIFAKTRDKSVPDMETAHPQVRELVTAIDKAEAYRQAGAAAGATITVNKSAIRDNIRAAKAEIDRAGSGATLSAVIKADAYGLGAPGFARLLREEGVKDFFVARTIEAVELRNAMRAENPATGDDTAVFLLDGPPAHANMDYLIEHKITPVLNSLEQIAQWNDAGALHSVKLPAILQFDTGMSRAGMSVDERAFLKPRRGANESDADFATRQAQGNAALSNINVLYVMSHLGTAGGATRNPDGTYTPNADTAAQRQNFEAVRADFPGTKATLAASSGIFLGPDYHYDMVRGGGVFHGQAPFGADENPLRPAVSLSTTVEQSRTLQPGDKVGYGGNFVATAETQVAVANIGYADGLSRIKGSNANGAPPLTAKATFVASDGSRHDANAIAATSMDMNTYDVTSLPPEAVQRGAKLNLIDDTTTLDHFGGQFGTNAAEFETKIAKRVHREFVVDPEDVIKTRNDLPKPIPAGASPNAWAVIPKPQPDLDA
ncbi:alanine racemase [Robbsia sp. KACC 23696]|uniref:alanine racemase n=1 Tax=Robbsia sp. KACC 23696 TaxID=3149231 RepID=UPI00325B0704